MTITIGIRSYPQEPELQSEYHVSMWIEINGVRFTREVEGKSNIYHATNSAFKQMLELTGISRDKFTTYDTTLGREWSHTLKS